MNTVGAPTVAWHVLWDQAHSPPLPPSAGLTVAESIALCLLPLVDASDPLDIDPLLENRPVILTTHASHDALFAHLRELTTVETEDGEVLYFRFHDPCVLRVFIPTCTHEQLHELFGPIAAFYVPAETPGTVYRFANTSTGLQVTTMTRDEFLGQLPSRARS